MNQIKVGVIKIGDLQLCEKSNGVLKEENQDLLKSIKNIKTKNSKL